MKIKKLKEGDYFLTYPQSVDLELLKQIHWVLDKDAAQSEYATVYKFLIPHQHKWLKERAQKIDPTQHFCFLGTPEEIMYPDSSEEEQEDDISI